MAFVIDNFDKLSAAGLTTAHKIWSYKSSTDTLATIAASAYFNTMIDKMAVDDIIYVKGSDGENNYVVTSVTTNVTVAANTTSSATYVVRYAGTSAYGGGGTSDAITVTGVAATDLVFAQLQASTNAVDIIKVVPTLNTVTVTFSADPGAATTIQYMVLRAA